MNENKMTPLCLAANRTTENLEVVQFLIEKGANPMLLCSGISLEEMRFRNSFNLFNLSYDARTTIKSQT